MKEGTDNIGFIKSVAREAGVELPDYYKANSGDLSQRVFQPEMSEVEKRIKEFIKENPDAQVIGVFKDFIKRIV